MPARLTRWFDQFLNNIDATAAVWFGYEPQSAGPAKCFISGCSDDDIDTRGPIVTRDGKEHPACVEHWEGIVGVVGRQQTWESDAYRSRP